MFLNGLDLNNLLYIIYVYIPICVCVCVYIYIYIHTHIYIYTYGYIMINSSFLTILFSVQCLLFGDMLVFAVKGVSKTSEVEQTLELATLWCMDLEGNNPQSGNKNTNTNTNFLPTDGPLEGSNLPQAYISGYINLICNILLIVVVTLSLIIGRLDAWPVV